MHRHRRGTDPGEDADQPAIAPDRVPRRAAGGAPEALRDLALHFHRGRRRARPGQAGAGGGSLRREVLLGAGIARARYSGDP